MESKIANLIWSKLSKKKKIEVKNWKKNRTSCSSDIFSTSQSNFYALNFRLISKVWSILLLHIFSITLVLNLAAQMWFIPEKVFYYYYFFYYFHYDYFYYYFKLVLFFAGRFWRSREWQEWGMAIGGSTWGKGIRFKLHNYSVCNQRILYYDSYSPLPPPPPQGLMQAVFQITQ